jgi:hypothetical protein
MMARVVASTCNPSSSRSPRPQALRACVHVCVLGLKRAGRASACLDVLDVLCARSRGGLETGNVSFIRMVGSEFVQKYLGEGPRMVRDVFRMAKENAPSIIFIDEIDAIATKRYIFMYISTKRLLSSIGENRERAAGRQTNVYLQFCSAPVLRAVWHPLRGCSLGRELRWYCDGRGSPPAGLV